MNQTFTFKSVLIALFVMVCCAAKAETYNGFTYEINLETQEASLSKYCGNAADVVVPEYVSYEGKEYKVTSLGEWCFSGCSSLASIEIPSSVTSLGYACFWGCSSLASITIPSSVTRLGDWCFNWCSSLASIAIPSSVTRLGEGCFYGCSSLASVEIPSTVTRLGDSCFRGCSSLASIEIPASMTSFGGLCFAYCPSLETIVVDADNPRYDSREGCNAIIETASNTMIAGCKSTFIPSSVTSLGGGCFYGCSSLVSIEIPASVTIISYTCFCDCPSLEAIVVDANNPRYDSREGCNAIIETATNTMIVGCKNTLIPFSVTSLGDCCFYGSSLTSIDIPSSVTSLGEGCFFGCSSLASIEIPASVTTLEYGCFWGCSSLASIDIPSSVMSLGDCCFLDCSSLVSITIPSSVTSIGAECFLDCYSLASIDIPSSVTSIGAECFFYCPSLKTVICRMENVESGSFFTERLIEDAILYVPESLLAIYQSTYSWNHFGTILPLTEEVELGIGNVSSPAVALRSAHGSVMLSGLADGTPVSYYSVDGRLLGRTSVDNGSASFSAKPNSIVTVKAGKQSFKVRVK